MDETLAEFEDLLGLGRLHMVHLNDSRAERGSLPDRHEHVGGGLIGALGLGRVVTHPALDHVTYILETPGMETGYDAINIGRVLDLAAGAPPGRPSARGVRGPGLGGRSAPAEEQDDPPASDPAPRRGEVP